jgi:hypothetical protein
MGEWMEAYIEGKDAEPNYYGTGSDSLEQADHYERISWKKEDLPDYFNVAKPKYKQCCWACRHTSFLVGYCCIDFTLMAGAGHCSQNFEPHGKESYVVWSFLYQCWRQVFMGNELGYKKWMKTEEASEYYQKARIFLKERSLI